MQITLRLRGLWCVPIEWSWCSSPRACKATHPHHRNSLAHMKTFLSGCIAALMLSMVVSACTQENAPNNTMQPAINIQLGLHGSAFCNALGQEKARINRQPAGVNFYERNWSSNSQGSVQFEHGPHSFTLNNVLTIMGTEDQRRLAFGVEDIYISFGLSPDDDTSHNDARLQTMALLKRLQDAGWQQYYLISSARLKGRSSLTEYVMDARYVPSFEEWMRLDSMQWKLQANGVYMAITLDRDGTRLDPEKPGAYLISMTLNTEEYYCRVGLPEAERSDWKTAYPNSLAMHKGYRADEEKAARAKGLEIDTDYQDQPILAIVDARGLRQVHGPRNRRCR